LAAQTTQEICARAVPLMNDGEIDSSARQRQISEEQRARSVAREPELPGSWPTNTGTKLASNLSMRAGLIASSLPLWFIATLGLSCGQSHTNPGDGGTGGEIGSAGRDGAAVDSGAGGTTGSTGSGGSAGTGGATGSGGSAGIGGATGSGGGTGTICGGIAGRACQTSEWCDFSSGSCGAGDQQGQCRAQETCSVVDCSNVVCGCDGHSYCNACLAHLRGFDTTDSRSCIPGNGGAGIPCAADTDCQTGFKCCRACGAGDCPIACTQVVAGAQCPALP
jgi:hypothetical protein